MRKRILVWAYFNKNLGDDLFIKIILERYNMHDFYLINCSEDSFYPFKFYRNVKRISLKEAIINIYKFSYFINIGGSIFQFEDTKWGSIRKRIIIALLNKITLGKNFVLGSNFGPYKYKESIRNTKLYFSLCKDVCFRDNNSYNLFNNMKNCRLATDIVFCMENIEFNNRIKDTIGISVMNLNSRNNLNKYREAYINKMIEVIKHFNEKNNDIYLISFCDAEGDNTAIQEILKGINKENKIKILSYEGNIEEFLSEYSKIDKIICCRFHSFILSQVFDQNVYPLVYSNKLLDVLNDLNMSKHYTKIENIINLKVENIEKAFEFNKVVNRDILKKSQSQFKVLDRYLINGEI